MIITRKEGHEYWATPDPWDPALYSDYVIVRNSTSSLFLVDGGRELGPSNQCEEWQFTLLGITGSEVEPEVGERFGFTVVQERVYPSCCEYGQNLYWRWPSPSTRRCSGVPEPGWYTGIACTSYSVWQPTNGICPGCGEPLPEPGIGEQVRGRQHLIGLLKGHLQLIPRSSYPTRFDRILKQP